MLALLAIPFFPCISYFLLLNEIKDFWISIFFYGFSTQSPNIISKASTLCSAKVVSQEDSKFVLQGVKKLFSSSQTL
jgi:hypothetical protein